MLFLSFAKPSIVLPDETKHDFAVTAHLKKTRIWPILFFFVDFIVSLFHVCMYVCMYVCMMYVCLCLHFCLGYNSLLVLDRSLKFSATLNYNLHMYAFSQFCEILVLPDETKRDFAVAVHLKKCTNLTNSFLLCWYHCELVLGCKWLILIILKLSKFGIFGWKMHKNAFSKLLIQLS